MGSLITYETCFVLISGAFVLCFSRGGAEEAAGRDQCGLSAAGAGQRAKQEDGPGAEDERCSQNQVRQKKSSAWRGRKEMTVILHSTVCRRS